MLGAYFEEAIDQADPEAQIEEEYKYVNVQTYHCVIFRIVANELHDGTFSLSPSSSLLLLL